MSSEDRPTPAPTQPRTSNLLQHLPVIISVVCLFGSCLMYIATLDGKISRASERIETLRGDMRESESRTNRRIDESNTRQDQQYAMIRGDIQTMNNKLDQILLKGGHN